MRRSERGGKTVYLDKVGIWWDEDDGHIHISVREEHDFISTVNANPERMRGNPNLFYKLAKCLRAAGAPHPPIRDDGRSDE